VGLVSALKNSPTGAPVRLYGKESTLPDAIVEYGVTRAELRRLAQSGEHEQIVRAGAIALFWLTTPRDRGSLTAPVGPEGELFREVVSDINQDWLAFSASYGFLRWVPETDPKGRGFVTQLLELTLQGAGPRDVLIDLLQNRRERSVAPVTGRQALEKWLGYSFVPPAYSQ
jgi:hypothetical protein